MISHLLHRLRAANIRALCFALAGSTALFCVPERARAAPIGLGPGASRYYART